MVGISEGVALQAAYNFTGDSACANGVTMQQTFLQGVVTAERELEALSTRLRGLSQEYSRFCDYEVCMRIVHPGNPTTQPGAQPLRYPPVSFRYRRSLISPQAKAVMRYLGLVDSDKSVMRRNCLEISVQGPVINFLNDLGFEREFAFVAEGTIYVRGRAKCLVYRINDVHNYPNPQSVDWIPKEWRPINASNWLIEVSAVGSAADDSLHQEVIEFADLLRPVVQLSTVDYTKFNVL
ncbi:Mediator of RNA polymerase II transcription subunit 18 [Cichlidogyrus casuarinus]|uniref:Mediator of RNA polymerase II transcription subunit 18 n=1 Tax=Cichlidogyrus casuarinus TaxID=1844966 RepID=A0ABD2QNB6_9PLAT